MSRLADNAMIDADGQVFFPDGPGDALYLWAEHGARPASNRFPWRCPETVRLWTAPGEFGDVVNTQCLLVDLHQEDHRGEVTW